MALRMAPWPAGTRPTTQSKSCELGLKARTTCLVPTSDGNPAKASEVPFVFAVSFQEKDPYLGRAHQNLDNFQNIGTFLGSAHQNPASFQEKAPFSGSAHQIAHCIQENSLFLGRAHQFPAPILLQVPLPGLASRFYSLSTLPYPSATQGFRAKALRRCMICSCVGL